MEKICVFCGSSPGSTPEYVNMASRLGTALAENNLGLVYGGGSVGMMGVLAKAVVKAGGNVTGVITEHLFNMEVGFTELSDLRVVHSMHERKALMADLSDGFISLPGGFGTMDEMFEIITWAQLDLHQKPCGFLNVNGYYDQLIGFIDHMIQENFIHDSCRPLVQVDDNPEGLIEKFHNYTPLPSNKGEWSKKIAANLCAG